MQIKKYPSNIRLKEYYKRVRNITTSCIRQAREEYQKRKINESQHDISKLWKTVNEFTHLKKPKSTIKTIAFNNQDIDCVTNADTAGLIFNDYFINVGKNVALSIHQTPHDSNQENNIIPPNEVHYSEFSSVTETEILKIITSLRNTSSPGFDNIQPITLKLISQHIVKPLTYIINLSLRLGILPKLYKKSIVFPVYKGKGNKKDPTQYRPISVLTNFHKIIEKCVKVRLDHYLNQNNLISDRQYGFRQHTGTEDILIDVTSHLFRQLDTQKRVLGAFLDVQKCYDSIEHEKLLKELKNIGLGGTVLNWFTSYLSNRTQQINLNSTLSTSLACNEYSIPQGTVLGPTLFNIFINPLTKQSKGEVYLYADDALILYSTNSWTSTFTLAQQDLTHLKKWYNSMSLKINMTKSQYMTFSLNNTGQPPDNLDLTITDHDLTMTKLEKVSTIRYLGVILDQHLKFKDHVISLKKKLRYLMYVFNTLKNICSQKIIRMIYFGLVQSSLQYCLLAWGGAYQNVIMPLKIAQNKILRIILKKDRHFPTDLLYSTLTVPSLQDIYIYKLCFFTVKHKNKWTYRTIPYNTRQRGHTNIQPIHRSFIQNKFTHLGPKIYNILPHDIKNANSKEQLKNKLHRYLNQSENKNRILTIIEKSSG
ncbi:hypothetical protein WDU94_012271 [Cyamophila willieti]